MKEEINGNTTQNTSEETRRSFKVLFWTLAKFRRCGKG